MSARGSFAFVLHSHLPYVRQAGTWPHGEEMVHEAIADTYLPLLDALSDLVREGCEFRLAVGITPILAEQLSDPTIVENFRAYMEAQIARTQKAEDFYAHHGQPELAALASWYLARHQDSLRGFDERYHGDLIGAFRRLQDAGYLEIVGSAATHGFLPLMSRESTIAAQIALGVRAHERHFGRKPLSFWLPECGYRPAYYELVRGHAGFRPGLETHLQRHGIRAFFADSTAVEGGEVSELDLRAGYSSALASGVEMRIRNLRYKSTAWPYLVSDSTVAVFGRDMLTGRQVWSASEGYPGHAMYRDFHKKDAISGMRFWRVTGPRVDLADKAPYVPEWAFSDVDQHVDHFVGILERHIAGNMAGADVPPIVVAPYDTELFGHWWFEGIEWLKRVLRRLANHPTIELTTPAAYLQRHPPDEKIALPESSWGAGSDARTWMNDQTKWMWPIIHQYERQMEQVVAEHRLEDGRTTPVLQQIARELLLLESSDWPFLISTEQAVAYASERFRAHAARFDRLVDRLSSGTDASDDLCRFHALDNPFPDVDPLAFAA